MNNLHRKHSHKRKLTGNHLAIHLHLIRFHGFLDCPSNFPKASIDARFLFPSRLVAFMKGRMNSFSLEHLYPLLPSQLQSDCRM